MKILLTGANGFVGRAMRLWLCTAGHECIAVTRQVEALPDGGISHAMGDISSQADWRPLLRDVDVIIHLAGLAHGSGKQHSDAQALFNEINVGGTVKLAKQAISAGVKRFVYVSTIGVHGASTHETRITELSPLQPYSPYTISKYCAEQELQTIASTSSMDWVIVRPPLIYAADAPGNFRQLLRLVASGVPLPLLGVKNLRSMIALDNLVNFLGLCCVHYKAANEKFVICDGNDISTSGIVEYLAVGMKGKARLFWLPENLLNFGAALIGRQHTYTQLFGSLRVDASKAIRLVGWQPIVSMRTALVETGRVFMQTPP